MLRNAHFSPSHRALNHFAVPFSIFPVPKERTTSAAVRAQATLSGYQAEAPDFLLLLRAEVLPVRSGLCFEIARQPAFLGAVAAAWDQSPTPGRLQGMTGRRLPHEPCSLQVTLLTRKRATQFS